MTRGGSWMQTFSGLAFYPLDARANEVFVADIAHALAHLCRYGGHTRRFYSVAEHSVLVSESVAPEHALAGLLHDATEAYMVDLPRPLKVHFPDYRAAEARLWRVIAERFGLAETLPGVVHEADERILVNERDALMSPVAQPWGATAGLKPLPAIVTGWTPEVAEAHFLRRFYELSPVHRISSGPPPRPLDAYASGPV